MVKYGIPRLVVSLYGGCQGIRGGPNRNTAWTNENAGMAYFRVAKQPIYSGQLELFLSTFLSDLISNTCFELWFFVEKN